MHSLVHPCCSRRHKHQLLTGPACLPLPPSTPRCCSHQCECLVLAQGAHPQQLRVAADVLPVAAEVGRAGQREKEEGVRRTGLWRQMGRVPHQKGEN